MLPRQARGNLCPITLLYESAGALLLASSLAEGSGKGSAQTWGTDLLPWGGELGP